MHGLYNILMGLLRAVLGADRAALFNELPDCYDRIRHCLIMIPFGLVVFYGLGSFFHYQLGSPYGWIFHGLYGLAAIICLVRIYRDIMVWGYFLLGANKKIAEAILARAGDAMKKGGADAEKVNKAIADAQAEFKAVIAQPEGEWSDMLLTAIVKMLEPLKLGANVIEEFQKDLGDWLHQASAGLKNIRAYAKERWEEEIKPISQFFVRLGMGIFFFSVFNTFLPWWNHPEASGIVLVGFIGYLGCQALPGGFRNFEFPKPAGWMKWLSIAGLAGLALAWLKVESFSQIEVVTLCAVMAGGPVLSLIAHRLKLQATLVAITIIFGVSGIVWAGWQNYQQQVPRYLRAQRVGGVPKHYRSKTEGVRVAGTMWFQVGQHHFAPKPGWQSDPDELVDFNTPLLSLASQAEKDETGALWANAVRVDVDGHPVQETPFYVPFRADYVVGIPDPGTPRKRPDDSEFNFETGSLRIDSWNTLSFFEFGRRHFGQGFQRFTWLGYEPAEETFAEPVDVDVEIGNGFESPLNDGSEYSGIDLVVMDQGETKIPVKASADGEIDGLMLNSYLSVTIKHRHGIWTHYGHLSTIASLLEGGRLHSGVPVKKGEVIGYLARGAKTGAHRGRPYLYFAVVRKQGSGLLNPVDPLPILGRAEYPPIPWKQAAAEADEEAAEEEPALDLEDEEAPALEPE